MKLQFQLELRQIIQFQNVLDALRGGSDDYNNSIWFELQLYSIFRPKSKFSDFLLLKNIVVTSR